MNTLERDLTNALSKLHISVTNSKSYLEVKGFIFTLFWPDCNNGMAELRVTLPDGRSRLGKVQTQTKGRSPWVKDNVHRLTPEAVGLLTNICIRNVTISLDS